MPRSAASTGRTPSVTRGASPEASFSLADFCASPPAGSEGLRTYFLGGLPFHQGGPHSLVTSAIKTTTRTPTSTRNAGDDTGGDDTDR